MRYLTAAMVAGSMLLFAGPAPAADNPMTIAVFTKNRTNPAYEAFRIASDQIARATGREGRSTSSRSSLTMSTNRRRWWSRS